MFRVRLKEDLAEQNLGPIVELATGMVGADVERAVKDARRAARRANGRPLTIDDLRVAIAGPDDRTAKERWRTCVHEAAHLLVDVVLFGPQDVYATSGRSGRRNGMSVRTRTDAFDGTPDAYRRLQVVLAGRAGEELMLGEVSHGAGGAPDSDLDKATAIAAAMAGSLGLTGPERLTYFGPLREAGDFLAFAEIRKTVAKELAVAAAAARELLEGRAAVLKRIVRLLADRGRVEGTEVAALLMEPDAEADGMASP
jgi:cell division protease FtsH